MPGLEGDDQGCKKQHKHVDNVAASLLIVRTVSPFVWSWSFKQKPYCDRIIELSFKLAFSFLLSCISYDSNLRQLEGSRSNLLVTIIMTVVAMTITMTVMEMMMTKRWKISIGSPSPNLVNARIPHQQPRNSSQIIQLGDDHFHFQRLRSKKNCGIFLQGTKAYAITLTRSWGGLKSVTHILQPVFSSESNFWYLSDVKFSFEWHFLFSVIASCSLTTFFSKFCFSVFLRIFLS